MCIFQSNLMQGFHIGVCEQLMCWVVHEFLCGQETILFVL